MEGWSRRSSHFALGGLVFQRCQGHGNLPDWASLCDASIYDSGTEAQKCLESACPGVPCLCPLCLPWHCRRARVRPRPTRRTRALFSQPTFMVFSQPTFMVPGPARTPAHPHTRTLPWRQLSIPVHHRLGSHRYISRPTHYPGPCNKKKTISRLSHPSLSFSCIHPPIQSTLSSRSFPYPPPFS